MVPTFVSDPSVRIVNPEDPDYFMSEDVAGVEIVEEVSAFSTKGVMKMFESDGEDLGAYNDRRSVIDEALKLTLMRHQMEGVSWMLSMEQLPGLGLNGLFWEEREFRDGGKFYFSPSLGQLRLKKPDRIVGGVLADEMGLGKTIMTVGLIIATIADIKAGVRASSDGDRSAATLIIVPPSLATQWMDELAKCTDDLECFLFDPKAFSEKYDRYRKKVDYDKAFEEIRTSFLNADVVITTYAALREGGVSELISKIEWARVCLDEVQEIRTPTSNIAKQCEGLKCERRWMISGSEYRSLRDAICDAYNLTNTLPPNRLLCTPSSYLRGFGGPEGGTQLPEDRTFQCRYRRRLLELRYRESVRNKTRRGP